MLSVFSVVQNYNSNAAKRFGCNTTEISIADESHADDVRAAINGRGVVQVLVQVSEVQPVRAGGRESGHLMPVPFSETALDVLAENVAAAMKGLPVPLALENIASFVRFPGGTMDEPRFLRRLLERTGASLLLDVANLHANALNHGFDAPDWVEQLPLHRLAYVHLANGTARGGLCHVTPRPPAARGAAGATRDASWPRPRARRDARARRSLSA